MAADALVDGRPWIVAIGASAGGLEALQRFFSALKPPTHAAFIVLQHLAPDHKSMMPELLGRHTPLKVLTAREGDTLQVDTVYLMPPAVFMSLQGDKLHLEPKPSHGVTLPIDVFFASLAVKAAERAIGVVLSGSGSDGSLGAAALRGAGAFVLVQSPESAKFDSMPRSAIAATQVDAVLPPDALAVKAAEIVQGLAGRLGLSALLDAHAMRPALQRIFETLLRHCGIDFNHYKLPTVMRRIERRMTVLSCATVSDYADRLDAEPPERDALRRELLIPVTSFFRDPAAFDALLHEVLVPLLRDRSQQGPLRVWCAGCATGEEAYSLAMLLMDACQIAQRWPGLKVFATDVDQRVLDVGSSGNYPLNGSEGLGSERLSHYFTRQDDRIIVNPELRQSVLFARHNLLDDAPFTKMDVVVCRNTLIYFQAEGQERVMRRLQYALNIQGALFLGSSESLGVLQPDFSTISSAYKLFRLIRPALTSMAVHDGFGRGLSLGRTRRHDASARTGGGLSAMEVGLAQLVQAYVPVSLLVNAQRQLVHAWGPAQRYLRVPEGAGTLDAFRLLPERLGPLAAHAHQAVLRDRSEVRAPAVEVELDGARKRVTLVGRAVLLEGGEQCTLLTLEEAAPEMLAAAVPTLRDSDLAQVALMERELMATRQSLQASIEELEAANEEMQATNEELMSSNEELQSTNEELQSVNEELYTVNAEYNAKLEALNALHADLEGMAQATGIATLFLDPDLNLVRFTPEAALLFRLRPSDAGRSIEVFNSLLLYPAFAEDLRLTLRSGEVVEREVQGPQGSWYLARLLSYGNLPGSQRRAVASFIEVSKVHDAFRLQGLIDSLPEHVAVLDGQGTIRVVNAAWRLFARDNGNEEAGSVGSNYFAALARSADSEALAILGQLQAVLDGRQAQFSCTYPCHAPDAERWFVMHATQLKGPDHGLVVTHFDVSALKSDNQRGPDPGTALPSGALDERSLA